MLHLDANRKRELLCRISQAMSFRHNIPMAVLISTALLIIMALTFLKFGTFFDLTMHTLD